MRIFAIALIVVGIMLLVVSGMREKSNGGGGVSEHVIYYDASKYDVVEYTSVGVGGGEAIKIPVTRDQLNRLEEELSRTVDGSPQGGTMPMGTIILPEENTR